MRRLPDQVSQVSHWLLLAGLAFYAADTASARLESRWSSAPLPLSGQAIPPIPQSAPALAVPPALIALMSTTAPPASEQALPDQPLAQAQAAQPVESRISVNLVGTMAGMGGDGIAMLTLNGQEQVVGTGQDIDEWRVVSVNPTSVLLERKGAQELLEIDTPSQLASTSAAAVATKPPQASAVTVAATPAPAGSAPEGLATPGVDPAGPVVPLTSKKEVVALLENPANLSKQGSLKPVVREGEIIGYTIRVKDPAFPLARLGLKTGDIVTSLNDVPANGPEGMSKMLRLLKNSDALNFAIERQGKPTTINVQLED